MTSTTKHSAPVVVSPPSVNAIDSCSLGLYHHNGPDRHVASEEWPEDEQTITSSDGLVPRRLISPPKAVRITQDRQSSSPQSTKKVASPCRHSPTRRRRTDASSTRTAVEAIKYLKRNKRPIKITVRPKKGLRQRPVKGAVASIMPTKEGKSGQHSSDGASVVSQEPQVEECVDVVDESAPQVAVEVVESSQGAEIERDFNKDQLFAHYGDQLITDQEYQVSELEAYADAIDNSTITAAEGVVETSHGVVQEQDDDSAIVSEERVMEFVECAYSVDVSTITDVDDMADATTGAEQDLDDNEDQQLAQFGDETEKEQVTVLAECVDVVDKSAITAANEVFDSRQGAEQKHEVGPAIVSEAYVDMVNESTTVEADDEVNAHHGAEQEHGNAPAIVIGEQVMEVETGADIVEDSTIIKAEDVVVSTHGAGQDHDDMPSVVVTEEAVPEAETCADVADASTAAAAEVMIVSSQGSEQENEDMPSVVGEEPVNDVKAVADIACEPNNLIVASQNMVHVQPEASQQDFKEFQQPMQSVDALALEEKQGASATCNQFVSELITDTFKDVAQTTCGANPIDEIDLKRETKEISPENVVQEEIEYIWASGQYFSLGEATLASKAFHLINSADEQMDDTKEVSMPGPNIADAPTAAITNDDANGCTADEAEKKKKTDSKATEKSPDIFNSVVHKVARVLACGPDLEEKRLISEYETQLKKLPGGEMILNSVEEAKTSLTIENITVNVAASVNILKNGIDCISKEYGRAVSSLDQTSEEQFLDAVDAFVSKVKDAVSCSECSDTNVDEDLAKTVRDLFGMISSNSHCKKPQDEVSEAVAIEVRHVRGYVVEEQASEVLLDNIVGEESEPQCVHLP